MLAELEIENLAVIAHARIPFSPQLNVFTGETGAGKSILIHGIHAVLGQRVTRDIVRTGCKKAVVTALFTHLDPVVWMPFLFPMKRMNCCCPERLRQTAAARRGSMGTPPLFLFYGRSVRC